LRKSYDRIINQNNTKRRFHLHRLILVNHPTDSTQFGGNSFAKKDSFLCSQRRFSRSEFLKN
jgi:hypothetical protein